MTRGVASFILLLLLSPAAAGQDLSSVLQEADAAFAARNFDQAVEKYVLALKDPELQKNPQSVADVSFKLGRSYRRLARFDDANRYLDQALKLHRELGDRNGEGLDLTELAVAQQRVGNYDQALSLSEQALAVHQETENKEGLARTLDNLGNIYLRKAEYSKAADFFNRAAAAAEEGGSRETLMNIWTNLGQVYYSQADYQGALDYYERSMQVAQTLGDPKLLGPIAGNEALVYWERGDLERGLEKLEQCLVLFKQAGNKQHEADTYLNIGEIQSELGNYRKAHEALQESLQMSQTLNDKGLAAIVLNSLGNLHRELGNYDVAENYFRRSMQISEETGEKRETGATLFMIGDSFEAQQRPADALQAYRAAFRIFHEIGDKNRSAYSLDRIGRAYSELGNRERALINHNAALAIRESTGSNPGISYLMIGSVQLSSKKLEEADASLTASIPLLEASGQGNLLWQAYYRKGQVCLAKGMTEEAIRWMKQAVEVIEKMRGSVELPEQKWAYLENKLTVYEDLIRTLIDSGDVSGAFEYVERSKARAFLDMLSEARIDPRGKMNSSQYDNKRRLVARLVDMNRKIQEENDKDQPDPAAIRELKEKASRLDAEYMTLMMESREQNPRYDQLQHPAPLNVQQAQALIDPVSAIAEYFVGKKQSMLFVITPDALRVFPLPGEAKLNQQVGEFLDAIQKPEAVWEESGGSFTRYRTAAALLYSELIKPAGALLTGKKRIILAPDGPLHYLPFESLLTGGTQSGDFATLPYLAVGHVLQYVPSVSALAVLRQEQHPENETPRKELIAFADPALAPPKSSRSEAGAAVFPDWSQGLPALPYARAEVEAISALFRKDKVMVLMSAEASEKNAKKAEMGAYRIVHFASHGLVDEKQPQFSALVLSPGDSAEDGLLTLREIFDLNLDAELVVLSACKSGLGRQVRGEGLAGLSRAFFSAGTSNVIVSLWNVDDRSTADFMTAFYKGLVEKGLDKAAALKAARLEMIGSGNYSHPYYWAPFILIGAN